MIALSLRHYGSEVIGWVARIIFLRLVGFMHRRQILKFAQVLYSPYTQFSNKISRLKGLTCGKCMVLQTIAPPRYFLGRKCALIFKDVNFKLFYSIHRRFKDQKYDKFAFRVLCPCNHWGAQNAPRPQFHLARIK